EPLPTEKYTRHRIKALLIIMHKDGYFSERLLTAEDLHEWIKRLEGNVPPIRYTDYDLWDAVIARSYTPVDFSEIAGKPYDLVSEHVGREMGRNTLSAWMPKDVEQEV